MRALFVAMLIIAMGVSAAQAIPVDRWRITKTEWTTDDEKGFGDFVRAIAESGCTTTIECMQAPANPYASGDSASLTFDADCAKWVYMLRAYYAWKNGLPFSYVDAVAGPGADDRFNATGNRILSRRDLVDHGVGLSAISALMAVHDSVSSATYRTDATDPGIKLSDFYSPKIDPGSIRAGTVLYDINGHVGIVYAVEQDGRVLYMDADPDHTVTRSVFGAQFGQSPAALGGGFKNFRPLKLVGAKISRDGSYIGGQIVPAADSEIADFSLEQYRGAGPDADGDGVGAMFRYRDSPVGLYDYVRGILSGGTYRFDPVYELGLGMDALCHQLRERGQYVDAAIAAGVDKEPEPDLLPGNIYASDDDNWEAYATPSRDARLKNSFAQLYLDIMKLIFRSEAQDANVNAGEILRNRLSAAYEGKAKTCTLTYTNSAGEPIKFGFEEAVRRMFLMSFDPYQCVERRWGATSEEELATCGDDETKTRWYKAEQNLRNQAERSYSTRAHFTLDELERGVALGSGAREPPPVDIAAMIAHIDREPLMAAMSPVGF